jgi:tetratricopeptide (TPR) repeat protein
MWRVRALSVALLASLWSIPAGACLWDRDTLKEESLKQKDITQIVKGEIEKHSKTFYEEKVAYTEPIISSGKAKATHYDDLAVAYDKLGRSADAIALMDEKEKLFPGLYETLANQGTFYAHSGDYEKALELLKKAVALNPKAHFGREVYQIKAIEFLQALKDDASVLEKRDLLGIDFEKNEFDVWVGRDKLGDKDAAKALAGIIRFGNGDQSPHLWMSLGLVLEMQSDRHLALRAFRRAEVLGHPKAASFAAGILSGPFHEQDAYQGKTWTEIGADFDKEFDAGQAKIAKLQEREDKLLREKKYKKVFGY